MKQEPFRKIIGIHSNPRSGSTWLAQILNSSPEVRYKYQPLKSRSFSGRINDHSTAEDIYQFYSEVYHLEDDYLDQNFQKRDRQVPVNFEKNANPEALVVKMVRYHYLVPHLLENIPEQKIIGLVRHPCAYLNSWKNAPKEFLPEWDFEEEWYFAPSYNRFRSGEYYGFHRWKEVAKMFLIMQRWYPDKFLLLRYEDLAAKTEQCVNEIFNFCDLRVHQQTLDFVQQSTSDKVDGDYSVFRGAKDLHQWKNHLEENVVRSVHEEIENTELEVFLR